MYVGTVGCLKLSLIYHLVIYFYILSLFRLCLIVCDISVCHRDGTAVGGKELGEGIDYVKTNGEITFQHGELSRDITIPVDPNSKVW